MNYNQDSTIFNQSRCIEKETNFLQFLATCLQTKGFEPVIKDSQSFEYTRWFRRGEEQILVSVVDSPIQWSYLYDLRHDYVKNLTSKDIIITDSHVMIDTEAHVYRLPDSWFGIYYHDVDIDIPDPVKPFSYLTHRGALDRIIFFSAVMDMWGDRVGSGNVSFNCSRDNHFIPDQSKLYWLDLLYQFRDRHGVAGQLPEDDHARLLDRAQRVLFDYGIPFRNYETDFDTAYNQGVIQVFSETYTSHGYVTFSEKTFRALVTPRPWICHNAPGHIQVLKKIGFNVLDDFFTVPDGDTDWEQITNSVKTLDYALNTLSWQRVGYRSKKAAEHNRALLKKLNDCWAEDLGTWMSTLMKNLDRVDK